MLNQSIINKEHDNDILSRNKTNMMSISANEFERTLFKTGLSSPIQIQQEKKEKMRKAVALRRERRTNVLNKKFKG